MDESRLDVDVPVKGDVPQRTARRARAERSRLGVVVVAIASGAAMVAGGLGILVTDLATPDIGYLSRAGVAGEPNASLFRWALWSFALGIAGLALLDPRATGTAPGNPPSRKAAGSVVLGVAAIALGITAETPCSAACKFPRSDRFSDAVHVLAAGVAISAIIAAMLLCAIRATSARRRAVSAVGVVCATVTAVSCAVTGIADLPDAVSGTLERLTAATILGWGLMRTMQLGESGITMTQARSRSRWTTAHWWATGTFSAVLLASWWAAPHPAEKLLHDSLTVVALFALAWVMRRHHLPASSYALILAFLAVHTIAARWSYSAVPYDEWSRRLVGVTLSEYFGWTRNNFDRLVHFTYGVCAALVIHRHLVTDKRWAPRWSAALSLTLVLSTSTLYELLEGLVAATLAPETAELYNGQQGDVWDAHKDISMALLGATVALAAAAGVRRLSAKRPRRSAIPPPRRAS